MNEPKSTLEHWDQTFGRIRALSNRDLTVEDVLLYYRLYRFDQNLVSKVLNRHRPLYPAVGYIIEKKHIERGYKRGYK